MDSVASTSILALSTFNVTTSTDPVVFEGLGSISFFYFFSPASTQTDKNAFRCKVLIDSTLGFHLV